MSASEFAFLALGLVIGVASGAAFVAVFRSRPPSREIRVTMTRDAIPRRSQTLSTDAFSTAVTEPARGGPADRRLADRDPATLLPAPPAGRPATVAPSADAVDAGRPEWPAEDIAGRTLVRDGVTLVGLPVGPVEGGPATPDPLVRVARAINPPPPSAARVAERIAAGHAAAGPAPEPPAPTALLEILRGDRSILVAVADTAARHDRRAAAEWEVRLDTLVGALTARAIDLGVLDFPLGHPFWDDFTIEECRRVAATLAASGHRFDGASRWSLGRVPTHAELSAAVVACGIQPTRVRAWPSRTEIADLYRGTRIAWPDLLATAPALDPDGLRVLLGDRGAGLDTAWLAWDDVRPHLLAEARASIR